MSRTPNLNHLVNNAIASRQEWLRKLLDPRRDIYEECGHPETITIENYSRIYLRDDIAARVVEIFPEETWSDDPIIFETEDPQQTPFEKAWQELTQQINMFSYLQRADTLSGIGRFGALLVGVDDGLPLDQPAEGIDEQGERAVGSQDRRLLFLRPFEEHFLTVQELQNDITNPRYGLPLYYNLELSDVAAGVPAEGKTTTATRTQRVHWSRLIHLADNRTNSEVWGRPRMEKVFNRLLDVRKIAGGSGEMFWKGGFPGFSIETQPGLEEEPDFDKDATRQQIESYMNGLQRYIATLGMSVKTLGVQIADPTPHIEAQMKLIATAIGVPWRVFIGSEAAQLASSQDMKAWNTRVNKRRTKYINPFVLSPFIERLIGLGVLPEPEQGFQIFWPDRNSPTPEEKASVAEKRSNALSKYVQSGASTLVPPFHYLTLVLGMNEDEARAIIEDAEDELDDEEGVGADLRGQRNGSQAQGIEEGEEDEDL